MAQQQAAKHSTDKPPYTCEERGCTTTFTRIPDALRHLDEKHGPQKPCPVSECSYLWRRKSRRDLHLQRDHHLGNVPLHVPENLSQDVSHSHAWSSSLPFQSSSTQSYSGLNTVTSSSHQGPASITSNYEAFTSNTVGDIPSNTWQAPTYAHSQSHINDVDTPRYGANQSDITSYYLHQTTEGQDSTPSSSLIVEGPDPNVNEDTSGEGENEVSKD